MDGKLGATEYCDENGTSASCVEGGDLASKTWSRNTFPTKADLTNDFYTKNWVDANLTKKTDISNFITDAALLALLTQYATKNFVNDTISDSLGPITIKGAAVGIGDPTPDSTLMLDVNGAIGAMWYCDEFGNHCVR